MKPDVSEFKKFYAMLLASAPDGYIPHLFVADKLDKRPHLARGPWSNIKNRITKAQAIKLMQRGFNIGIAGMNDNLIIVDIDNESAIDPDTLVPTLSVRSRSRTGSHYFYFIDRVEDKINIAVQGVGELRAQHQFVIVAGSYVPTDSDALPVDQIDHAGYYTVESAIPPAHIIFNDLPLIFRQQYTRNYLIPLIKDKMASISRIFDNNLSGDSCDRKSKSAIFDLAVPDVVHVPRDGRNFISPLHGSKNGQNCTYSNGWLHCFRCCVSHNAVTLLAVMAGVDSCANAGYGYKHSCAGRSSIDMTDGETCYRVWDFARRRHYLPADDPPPNAALRYFVVETGICNAEDIEDGWRVPAYAYAEGRRLLRANL